MPKLIRMKKQMGVKGKITGNGFLYRKNTLLERF